MKTSVGKWNVIFLITCFVGLVTACSKESAGVGQAEIQVTDAPSDDASIQSVFVTIAEVRLDGKAISGFTKQTIDLKAYQSGNVKSIGMTSLAAGAHSQLTFVLDVDHDATGNAPGCYVQTIDNAKYKLGTSGNLEIAVSKTWNLMANSSSTLVADFDLRKAIKASTDNAIRYMFVSTENLGASVRIVEKTSAGQMNGTYAEQTSTNAAKVIVYAYKPGTFNSNIEAQAQGNDEVYFQNAVSSAEVTGVTVKSYVLAFLEAGTYELHFASYTKDATTGRFIFQSMLSSQTKVNGSITDFITVNANATVSISSMINL